MKHRSKVISYPAMRVSLLAFLLLLAFAAAALWLYPYICLQIGTRAAERGDTEKAVLWLTRAGKTEQKNETPKEASELLEQAIDREIDRLMSEERYEEALAALLDNTDSLQEDERILICRYELACLWMKNGDYPEAEKQFSYVLSYQDAAERYRECGKQIAAAAFEAGDLKTALDYIAKNPTDPSMQELNEKIIIVQAEELLQSESPEAGLKIILELWQKGKMNDSDLIRAERTCYPYLYENKSDDEILEAARVTNAAQAEKRNELLKQQNKLPKQVLAVGNLHTVALRQDGTVLAAGDHSYGQCDVSGWTDIVSVSAGAFHTIGLKKDGTVVATGDNRYGQCETDGIHDAIEIEAHGFDTVVRLKDGSILCFGFHNYAPLVSGWTNIKDLSAGGYALVGISEDGSAMATSASYLNREFQNLIAIDAANGYAAGINADGHLVSSSPFVAEWNDVLSIEATANGILGLMADGSVRLTQAANMDISVLSDRSDIIAIAYSGTHAAVLLQDGSYLACGENSSGQCDVAGWRR